MFDNINCPKCGKTTPSASFCKYCGAPLLKCPSCGGKLSSDATFCQHCGEPLNVCPSCGEKLTPDARFCPKCGADSRKKHQNESGGDEVREPRGAAQEKSTDVIEADQMPKAGQEKSVTSTADEVINKPTATYGKSIVSKDIMIKGEVPLFETRPDLLSRLISPICFMIAGLVIFVVTYILFQKSFILYLLGGVFLIGSAWVILRWLQWRCIIYTATSLRIISQTGFLYISHIDCPIRSVQNISLHISPWDKINDLGTLHIVGSSVEINWASIPKPAEAHRELLNIVERYRGGVEPNIQQKA